MEIFSQPRRGLKMQTLPLGTPGDLSIRQELMSRIKQLLLPVIASTEVLLVIATNGARQSRHSLAMTGNLLL